MSSLQGTYRWQKICKRETLQNLLSVMTGSTCDLFVTLMNVLLNVQLIVNANALIMSVLVIMPTRLLALFEYSTTARPLILFLVIICGARAKSVSFAMVLKQIFLI